MKPPEQLRLSLGFMNLAFMMLFGMNRGRRSPLSPAAIEVLYTAYFSRICMSDVSRILDISPSSATDLISYLEREGYVTRATDEQNHRVVRVTPTEKGEEWILTIEERLFGYIESRLQLMAAGDQEQFAELAAQFSGVDDGGSFIRNLAVLKSELGRYHIPLITRKNGRLMRLEDVVTARYHGNFGQEDHMVEMRVQETVNGIPDEVTVEQYDEMQRNLRDAGHLPVDLIREHTRAGCHALEIGPGPGYLGLEWLKATEGAKLSGLEISPAMIRMAEKNADAYGLRNRVMYTEGTALSMTYPDGRFDLVFSNGSMHEWEDPVCVFREIQRVLKEGGLVIITDLRRDLSPEIYHQMYNSCFPETIRPGFASSVRAAYTPQEIEEILKMAGISGWSVLSHPYGLGISSRK